jgi:ubiquitin-conjugating enzyme E2 J1
MMADVNNNQQSKQGGASRQIFAVKRIMREFKEMKKSPFYALHAEPLEDNLFEWHFTIRGPEDTVYAGGLYHGWISLPTEYPFKPPDIHFLTPSGRFQVGKKICLSITKHHPKSWQPSWSIKTVLLSLRAFLPTAPGGALGSLEWSDAEKRKMAIKSHAWACEACGRRNDEILPPMSEEEKKQAKEGQFGGKLKKEEIVGFAYEKQAIASAPATEEEGERESKTSELPASPAVASSSSASGVDLTTVTETVQRVAHEVRHPSSLSSSSSSSSSVAATEEGKQVLPAQQPGPRPQATQAQPAQPAPAQPPPPVVIRASSGSGFLTLSVLLLVILILVRKITRVGELDGHTHSEL